ncbi:MAG: rod shape-determining protein [Bacteroidales bacterium]
MFGTNLAIDLGTANTCVFVAGKGVVVNEPSVVAFNVATAATEAVGSAASLMLGRTPANIRTVKPLKGGAIADYGAAEKMLVHFMKKAHRHTSWNRPRVVIGVPPEVTQLERRSVKDSVYRAKARQVHLIEQPLAAAIGVGMAIAEPAGNLIVDVGGGTTDIAVISLGGVVHGKSVRVAGEAMDEAIIQYMRKARDLLIGERTAEQIKIAIGSADPLDEPLTMEVKGRDQLRGVPRTVVVKDAEIREALASTVRTIILAVMDALERTPPEIASDIYERGLVLTGGGSLLQKLDERLRRETELPVHMAEEPLSSVVKGAGKILGDLQLLKRLSMD